MQMPDCLSKITACFPECPTSIKNLGSALWDLGSRIANIVMSPLEALKSLWTSGCSSCLKGRAKVITVEPQAGGEPVPPNLLELQSGPLGIEELDLSLPEGLEEEKGSSGVSRAGTPPAPVEEAGQVRTVVTNFPVQNPAAQQVIVQHPKDETSLQARVKAISAKGVEWCVAKWKEFAEAREKAAQKERSQAQAENEWRTNQAAAAEALGQKTPDTGASAE